MREIAKFATVGASIVTLVAGVSLLSTTVVAADFDTIAMKAGFPDQARLYEQIWDAQMANPATRMPPFGKHEALSKAEIDVIVDYRYTL